MSRTTSEAPWLARMVLLFPETIATNLERVERARLVERAPTLFQLALGVIRMQVRLATRPNSIGHCTANPVRGTLRARLLASRPLRFPFLIAEQAIAPLDFSGLASSRERVLRHLLAAHHDGNQFAYDLEMLAIHPGALDELADRTRAILDGRDERGEWLKDLCVFEGYHEELLVAVETARASGVTLPAHEAEDPDISFLAYLDWCASQPESVTEAARALLDGGLSFGRYRHATSTGAAS